MSRASDIADEYIGTARNMIPEEELETKDDLVEFDELAFMCDQCGWWCSTEELNNGGMLNLCDDCHGEDDE